MVRNVRIRNVRIRNVRFSFSSLFPPVFSSCDWRETFANDLSWLMLTTAAAGLADTPGVTDGNASGRPKLSLFWSSDFALARGSRLAFAFRTCSRPPDPGNTRPPPAPPGPGCWGQSSPSARRCFHIVVTLKPPPDLPSSPTPQTRSCPQRRVPATSDHRQRAERIRPRRSQSLRTTSSRADNHAKRRSDSECPGPRFTVDSSRHVRVQPHQP